MSHQESFAINLARWDEVVAIHAADAAKSGAQDATALLRPTFPYFSDGKPLQFEMDETYTGDGIKVTNTRTHEFVHGIGDILSALIDAGLTLTYFAEHDSLAWAMWPKMVEGHDRMYRMLQGEPSLPLSFSVKARKI